MRAPRHVETLADLELRLRTLSEGPSALREVPAGLQEAFGAARVLAYTLAERGDRLKLESAYTVGLERPDALRAEFDAYLAQAPTDWATFNPIRPEAAQRNLPMDMHDIERATGESALKPLTQTLYPRHGLRMEEQLRLLVCQDHSLLAWVGLYREEPFSSEERLALRELAKVLRFRLDVERRLALVPLQAQIIDRALEAVAGAAFLLSGAGRIAHANSRGRALLARADRDLADSLARGVRDEHAQGNGRFEVTRLRSPGMSDRFLVIERPGPPAGQVLAAADRWGLTSRQREVLLHLAQGRANRTIAAELGCAESTVEIHVTAILAKAGAESRAELIARVYTQQ